MTLDRDQRISEVVQREQSRLRNFIRRRVPDPRDAEDIFLALSRILFGGFGGSQGSGRSRFRRRMAERWEQSTPEERERFRQGLRERCDFGHSPGESKS